MRGGAAVLVLGLALWAAGPLPVFGGFVLAYVLAWAVVGYGLGERVERVPGFWVVAGAVGLLAALGLWRRAPEILENEQLLGVQPMLRDRARVMEVPSIAPPIAVAGRPQVFFVFAPEAREVSVRFGASEPLPAEALGHGLFRLEHAFADGLEAGLLVARIEADGRAVERSMRAYPAVAHPRRLSASSGVAAAVSEETDALFVLRREGEPSTFRTADGPTDCAVLAGGEAIAVAHRYSPELRVVRASDGAVLRAVEVGAGQRAVAAGPGLVAVAREKALVLVEDGGAVRTIALPFTPDRVAIGGGGAIVVSSRDTLALHLLEGGVERRAPIVLGRPALALALAPAAGVLVASVTDYLPDRSPGANHEIHDQLVTVDLARWRVTGRVETAVRGEDGAVVSGASPVALAAGGPGLLVAFAGTAEVAGFAGERRVFSRQVFDAPSGVADLGGGVIAVSSAATGALARIEPEGVRVFDVARAPRDTLERRGERAFSEATRSGASCASCHVEDDDDGALHDIGHGVGRPTLSVRGVAGTAPYLRGASYPAVAGLQHFADTLLGGYARAMPGRAEALGAYVESLPLPYNPRKSEPAGAGAFVRARCDHCHAFPAFTDLAQRPARVIFPEADDPARLLDTPSLRGIAASAPYLEDGRARTLDQVLDEPRTRHGDLSTLGPAERAALVRFLESL